jgi:predicted 3-demethylubiquinone-9 3-methyltransferase (glyoxalase superfamily)
LVVAGVYRLDRYNEDQRLEGGAMPSITPSLWFDHNMEEALTFYSSVFPNSRIEELDRATDAGPGEPGSVLSGSFVLDGTRFIGINGGP